MKRLALIILLALSHLAAKTAAPTEDAGDRYVVIIKENTGEYYEEDVTCLEPGEDYIWNQIPWNGEDTLSYRWENGLFFVNNELIGIDLIKTSISEISDINRIVYVRSNEIDPEQLDRFNNLEVLNLWDSYIPDTCYANLKNMKKLRWLTLRRTNITDPDLINLENLTNLKGLDLSFTFITDTGLVYLENLTNLRTLYLMLTSITDTGLIHLEGLNNLIELNLSGPSITDTGLVHLKGLTSLKKLNLSGQNITDTGLIYLEELNNLEKLNLLGTNVTEAGVKKLQKALSECDISW